MGFYDAFFGSDQSLYTAYAIIAAIISICVTILFTSTDIPVGSRLLMILFVVITLVPSIFLTLFEITCIVTGGTEPNNWWCYTFGWILAAFIIIYCIFVVIISIMSLVTYNKAIDNVNNDEEKNKVNPQEANHIAKQIMATQKPVEKFYDTGYDNMMNTLPQNFQLPSMTGNLGEILTSLNQDTTGGIVGEIPPEKRNIVLMQTQQPHEPSSNMIATFANSAPTHKQSSGAYVANFANLNQPTSAPTSAPTPKPTSAPKPSVSVSHFGNNNAKFSDYDSTLTGSEEDTLSGYPDIFNN